MRNATLLLILAAAGTVTVASAQRQNEPSYKAPAPTIVATPLALAIAGFDGDGDMVVSRAEFETGVARSLLLADADKDARVSLIELAAWSEAALGNRGALPGQFDFDRNGDDSISRDEFTALFETRFASLDKDSDKALRRSELVSFAVLPPVRLDRRQRDEFREPPPR